MDINTGKIHELSDEMLKLQKHLDQMVEVQEEQMTAKQKEDKFVALRDHRSELGKIRQQEIKKIGRNSPCPCGSGKKYKRCCLR